MKTTLNRMLALLLAAVMLLALAACTKSHPPADPVPVANEPQIPQEPAAPAVPEQPAEPAREPGERYPHLSKNGIETNDSGCVRSELSALELTKLMGNGINLGNTMEACDNGKGRFSLNPKDFETYWGQPVTTQEMISGMKEAGFDSIRIPVAWITNATSYSKDGSSELSELYLNRVEEIINYAINADMYVILNDHWDGGWWSMFGSEREETRAAAMELFVSMWTQLALRYEEYSDYLIFECANEELGNFDTNAPLYCTDANDSFYTKDEQYELTNRINQTFVDTVRATGGNNAERFLLIAGLNTNVASTCDDRFKMPSDTAENKLLISVHYYDPWSYCGDGQSSVKWGTVGDYEYMRDTLGQLRKFTGQGYGVVIGEYGVLHETKLQENTVNYHTFFLSLCDLYNYTSCLWDCSGFYIRRELRMIDSELASLYSSNNYEKLSWLTDDQLGQIANRKLKQLMNDAPETFRDDAIKLDDATAVAWIMWDSNDFYSCVYSVGDTYNPDNISAGVVPTELVVNGEGVYTVGLDFTATPAAYSDGIGFAALAVGNGKLLYPDYVIDIQECLIDGEPYDFIAEPYTSSDNGITARVNLYNGWVNAVPDDARTASGSLENCSPVIIDPATDVKTISITFRYGPAEG